MQAVFEALNRREANLVAIFLEDHGIPVEVQGGAFQSVEGELRNIRGILPKLYVLNDQDADRARQLVETYRTMLKDGPAGEPWRCPACGETLEPQFRSCWKCQTEKPA
jgi:hypothetical protein